MKLLFDQNLSPKLMTRLADIYPDSNHVHLIGLDTVPDPVIWEYARDNEFIIVTRDADFSDLNVMLGFPPKVIWIRRGNCTTGEIEVILRSNLMLEYVVDPSQSNKRMHRSRESKFV